MRRPKWHLLVKVVFVLSLTPLFIWWRKQEETGDQLIKSISNNIEQKKYNQCAVRLDADMSPGSMGSPVKLGRLEGEERRRASDGWRLHAFNE